MFALTVLLLMQPTLEDDVERWKAVDSTRAIVDGALRWEAAKESSTLSADVLPAGGREIGRIAFRIRAEGDRERTLDVRLPQKDGLFWRKIAAGREWTDVSVAPWQFRSVRRPSWEKLATIEFSMREAPGAVLIDGLRVEKPAEAGPTWLEPAGPLAARAFGDGARESRRATTASFRVFTDAPLDAEKIGATLEEFLALFQKTWGLSKAALDYPVTLVVAKTREAYTKFVERTSADVYASVIDADDVKAGGFTFEQYSVTSYLEEAGEKRPVFYHEACHQLVKRLLGLRGDAGATWIEEGICYFLQNEFLPQPGLAAEVAKLLDNPRRTAVERFDGRLKPAGSQNLQSMTYAAMIAASEKRDEIVASLRERASLRRAVEDVLKLSIDEFEKKWLEFCRDRWR
jgi:hypothetical protein